MSYQELRECLVEINNSDIPNPSQEKIVDALLGKYKDKWILCSKQLPKAYISVLVCTDEETEPVIAWHSKIGQNWINASTDIKISSEVIAWMPLPKSYREEVEE